MKNQLRIKSIEIRNNLNTQELSKKVLSNLLKLEEYKKSTNILCYYPLEKEVNTIPLLNDNSKIWYLPRVKGRDLEICKYNSKELACGSYKIQEPTGTAVTDLKNIELIIVPAIACDVNGYRLGWGKGYYDRFLASLNHNPIIVFLTFSPLVYQSVFPQEHDIKCNILISDKEILRIDC